MFLDVLIQTTNAVEECLHYVYTCSTLKIISNREFYFHKIGYFSEIQYLKYFLEIKVMLPSCGSFVEELLYYFNYYFVIKLLHCSYAPESFEQQIKQVAFFVLSTKGVYGLQRFFLYKHI